MVRWCNSGSDSIHRDFIGGCAMLVVVPLTTLVQNLQLAEQSEQSTAKKDH